MEQTAWNRTDQFHPQNCKPLIFATVTKSGSFEYRVGIFLGDFFRVGPDFFTTDEVTHWAYITSPKTMDADLMVQDQSVGIC